jgi:uncharacterized protein
LKQNLTETPTLRRVDNRLMSELSSSNSFDIQPVREDFDYVYKTSDLIKLSGGDYHAKRNYINTFINDFNGRFTYEELGEKHIAGCQEMAERWCASRRCDDDLGLMAELSAVNEALTHFKQLDILGGVISIDNTIEAFTLGEMLNSETAVIHVEKANPEIRGLYSIINQKFCEHNWSTVPFINREQDLGEPQLRKAKLSYYPSRMVQKYQIKLKQS